jgi:cation diffusion facilitator CzcD-associated flavoprotein CzcO
MMRASMRIVIVGAGPAGLAMGMRLAHAGYDDFTIVERSRGVGGTWHDNRYPGCGCDVPSHLYCFSFAPKPDWQHKFARQPEIEQYFQRCVELYGLAPHLQLDTEVLGAQFVDGAWRIRTSRGELTADVLISGTGQLNRPRTPALPGAESFAGTTFHSARWPEQFDPRGKRVVVIGNGASAAQFVPELVPQVAQLTLLQRTPSYVFPRNCSSRASRRSTRTASSASSSSGWRCVSCIGRSPTRHCARSSRRTIRSAASAS